MRTQIVTIRRADALTEVILSEKDGVDFETNSPEELEPIDAENALYDFIESPLISDSKSLTTRQMCLLTSWTALSSVNAADADVLFNVSVVLIETVSGQSQGNATAPAIPSASLPDQPARIQPTAAHPRAFQGTKYKPPKEKAAPPQDLRMALCDPRSLEVLLSSLQQYWPVVRVRLKQAGYSEVQIAGLMPNEKSLVPMVILEFQLPAVVRAYLQPLIRHLGTRDAVKVLAGYYWALELEGNPQLCAALCKLVGLHVGPETVQWFQIITQVPHNWRLTFVQALIASGAYDRHPDALLLENCSEFQQVFDGPCPVYRLYCLLRAPVIGVETSYLLQGFGLANRSWKKYRFHEIDTSGFFPERAVADLIDHQLAKYETRNSCPSEYWNLALLVWKYCGCLDGFGDAIKQIPWSQYAPEVVPKYLEMYYSCVWDELPPDKLALKWTFIRGRVSAIEELLESIAPEYQLKCISHLQHYFWAWDEPPVMSVILPHAYAIARRLAQPPFRKYCQTSSIISDVIGDVSAGERDRFLSAPDASYLRLEEGCRLSNSANLIEFGARTLAGHIPGLAVDAFVDYPGKFVKVAKLLGSVGRVARELLAKDFAQAPIMDAGLLELPLPELVDALERIRDASAFDPVPRRLKSHLAGTRRLGEIPLQRLRDELNKQITRTRLEMLEAEITRLMERGLAPGVGQNDAARHALQLHSSIDRNRLALRKYLRAYWNGEPNYIIDHTLTQRWLAGHPGLPTHKWLRGVPYCIEHGDAGQLRLAVAQDGLEALKLGTYVGSCLGLGGLCDYSAAAVALDINKQVIYARDARGNVIARQLVAISEDDQLVCFEVYPYSVESGIKQLFADYDRVFAEALGVAIYRVEQDEAGRGNANGYEIAHILSHDWWDDFAWDLNPEADEGYASSKGTSRK